MIPVGQLPPHELQHFPSGSWGYVGQVDARLAYARADGSEPTAEDLERARRAGGPQYVGLRKRTWPTKQEAIDAATRLGVPRRAAGEAPPLRELRHALPLPTHAPPSLLACRARWPMYLTLDLDVVQCG
jgi:hypothetical protein